MRPKCAKKTYVGLWGQSTVSIGSHRQSNGLGCYKWYHSNPATVADLVFSAPSGEKIPKLRCNEDVAFLTRGECDTSD